MNTPYKYCPLCGSRVNNYVATKELAPLVHSDDVECRNDEFIHLKFSDGEHRLIRLGVSDPVGCVEFGEVSNET